MYCNVAILVLVTGLQNSYLKTRYGNIFFLMTSFYNFIFNVDGIFIVHCWWPIIKIEKQWVIRNWVRGQRKKIERIRATRFWVTFLVMTLMVVECWLQLYHFATNNSVYTAYLSALTLFRILYFLLGWSYNNKIIVHWELNHKVKS
jgi:hypothetical protein